MILQSLEIGSEELVPLLSLEVQTDADAVFARQRARQLAELCRMDVQSQTRFATAVSELARNIHQYAGRGKVSFSLDLQSRPQRVIAEFFDQGPGIGDVNAILDGVYSSPTGMGVGLSGARRLMDGFEIASSRGAGTQIRVRKNLPLSVRLERSHVHQISFELTKSRPPAPSEEVLRQNHELMLALGKMEAQSEELAELNRELGETNSGVLALYAELDEKASSLQRANEVKTNFLSHMTHEFRTPLTSIISIAQILLDRLDGDLTPEQEKQVSFISESARGLLDLVSDLLDLAKVEAGKVGLRASEIELVQLLGTLRGMFKPIVAQNPDIILRIDDAPEGVRFVSDEGKVGQILRNLVSNALKFTEQGEVHVSVEVQDGTHVQFRVRDTGVGISEKDLPRLFEDFAQVESRVSKKQKGTGLGLPLSRKLARLLGGDLTVESHPGKGSTFSVRLPLTYEVPHEGTLVAPSMKGAQ